MNERTPSTYKETPYTYKKLQLISLSSHASLMPTTVLATKNVPSLSRPFLVKGAHTGTPTHKHILFVPCRILKIGKVLPTNPDFWLSLEEPKEQAMLGSQPHPAEAAHFRWGTRFLVRHGPSLPHPYSLLLYP